MTDLKIGQHVYEIFDPRNNGMVIQLDGEKVLVKTEKREVWYDKSRVTIDYHSVINDLIGRVDEWRELWFQKKDECETLRQNRKINSLNLF